MPIMTDRVFLLVSVHQGAVLGIHCHASRRATAVDVWTLLHNEGALCQVLFGGLPELPGDGMWCVCAEIDDVALCCDDAYKARRSPGNAGFQPERNSPAPEWRRPTLDEMIQIIEGRTPPAIVKWTRFEAWGE